MISFTLQPLYPQVFSMAHIHCGVSYMGSEPGIDAVTFLPENNSVYPSRSKSLS
jgi:hypothetical protein